MIQKAEECLVGLPVVAWKHVELNETLPLGRRRRDGTVPTIGSLSILEPIILSPNHEQQHESNDRLLPKH